MEQKREMKSGGNGGNKSCRRNLSTKPKRITKQIRLEMKLLEKLKPSAKAEKMTLSKLLGRIVAEYLKQENIKP